MGCGTTHLMEIWNIWHVWYLSAGVLKALTAAASLATAISLIPLVPRAIALPSPQQLEAVNRELAAQVVERQRVEQQLRETLQARERTLAELEHRQCTIDDLEVARAALAESRARLDAIIHSAMDAIVTSDEQQRILLFNAAAEKMFGCSAEQAIGEPLERFIPQRFRAAHREHHRRFAETGVTSRAMGKQQTLWALRWNAEEFQIEASISQATTTDKKLFTVILRDVSEQMRLQARNLRLAAIVDSSDDAIFSKDLAGRITSWNHGAERMFGYSEAEMAGKNVRLVVPENRQTEVDRFMEEIAQGRQITRHETTRRHKNGSEFHVSLSLSPLRGENGEIIGAAAIVRDISERVAAERGLREYKDALDQHAEVSIANVEGRITYANDRFCSMSGYSREELIGQNHRIVNSGFHSKEFFQEMWQTITRGGVWHGEVRNRSKHGGINWLQTTIVPFLGENRKPRQYMAIRADITERKLAEEALRASEERMQLFIEHAPAALAMFDREMRYLYASRRWRNDYGLGDRNLLGVSHYDVFPEVPERWKEAHRRGLAGEVLRAENDRFERSDGSLQWIRWEVRPWYETGGAIGGIVIFAEDITENVHAEEALRESEGRLRALVNATSDVVYRMSPDWSEMHQLDGRGFIADTTAPIRDWLQVYIPPDDQALVTQTIQNAIRNKSVFELEHRVRQPDGSVGWTQSRAVPRLDADGEIVEWFGTASNVTPRKLAEETLRENHARLKRVLEVETVGVMFWDLTTGCLTDANDTFLNLMGYSRREVEARELTWQKFTPPEYLEVSRAELRKERALKAGAAAFFQKPADNDELLNVIRVSLDPGNAQRAPWPS